MRITILIHLLSFFIFIKAQEGIKINPEALQYSFDGSEEEKLYNQILKNENDSLNIFFEINSTIIPKSIKDKFKFQIKEKSIKYDYLNIKDKKFEKKLTECFKDVHDEFLVQYDANADFNDILNSGKYNCLSATALYCMLLNQLSIPFIIKKGYFHIYLIIAPGSHNITLESTLPEDGIIYFSDNFKKHYVQSLSDNKLISKDDKSLSNEELFSKYSNTDETISQKDLIAYQYYNVGISYYLEENFSKSLNFFSKSYFLLEDEITAGLIAISALALTPKKPEALHAKTNEFILSCNIAPRFYDDLFKPMMHDYMLLCVENGDKKNLESTYAKMHKGLKDETLLSSLECSYNLYYPYFLQHEKEYDKAFTMLTEYFDCDSNEIVAKEQVSNLIRYEVTNTEDYLSMKNKLDLRFKSDSIIMSHEQTRKLYLNIILQISADYFAINNSKKGVEFLETFRLKSTNWQISKLKGYFLGSAYSQAAAYYNRKEKFSKARTLINEGLEFDPFNEQLNKKLDIMNKSGY